MHISTASSSPHPLASALKAVFACSPAHQTCLHDHSRVGTGKCGLPCFEQGTDSPLSLLHGDGETSNLLWLTRACAEWLQQSHSPRKCCLQHQTSCFYNGMQPARFSVRPRLWCQETAARHQRGISSHHNRSWFAVTCSAFPISL